MTESFTTFIPQAMADYSLHGVEPEAVGNRHATQAPHGVYVCRGDQRWIAISVDGEEAWAALCDTAGRPGWRNDPRFATAADRCANVEALESLIEAWTRNEEAAPLAEKLQRAGVAATEVLDSDDLLTDEHLVDRGFVATVDHPEVGPAPWAQPLGASTANAPPPSPRPPARRALPPRPGRPLADGPGGDRRSGAPRHRHRLR